MSAEIWKDIPEYEGIYQVSSHGRIKRLAGHNCRRERLLSPSRTDRFNRYQTVSLCQNGRSKPYRIHHLVLAAFVGPRPERLETRHLDGNSTNNRLENLQYGTNAENTQDRMRHSGYIHISDAQIQYFYEQERKSCAEIAQMALCSETTIYNKLKKMGVQFRSRSAANKVFPDFIFIILYNLGLSASQVGRLLGVHASTVTKRLQSISFPTRTQAVAVDIGYSEEEFQQHFMTPSVINAIQAVVGERTT